MWRRLVSPAIGVQEELLSEGEVIVALRDASRRPYILLFNFILPYSLSSSLSALSRD